MPTYSTCRFGLSGDSPKLEIPSFLPESVGIIYHRVLNEYALGAFDMTGRDVVLSNGGCRSWQDVLVRYVRFVPMTDEEVADYRKTRELARKEGRPFAGYVEPCTPAHYLPRGAATLREHLHNEMLLNERRGSTDVYVHVLRMGCKAWYHSDRLERFLGDENENWCAWMNQGDPLAVAIGEARGVGLKAAADVGMNSPYTKKTKAGLTERFAREHPEFLLKGHDLLDYRHAAVRDYVVSIFEELFAKYDLDGVNLDFGRWGYRPEAYTKDSLVDVARRIDRLRKAAEKRIGHPIYVSARVDYAAPPTDGDEPPATVAALGIWAKEGLVDRIMVNHDPVRPKINPSELPLGPLHRRNPRNEDAALGRSLRRRPLQLARQLQLVAEKHRRTRPEGGRRTRPALGGARPRRRLLLLHPLPPHAVRIDPVEAAADRLPGRACGRKPVLRLVCSRRVVLGSTSRLTHAPVGKAVASRTHSD